MTDPHFGWPSGGMSPRNTYQFSHALDSMNVAKVDFLILGGDWSESSLQLNQGNGADSLALWLARYSFPWYPVLGNWEALVADTLAAHNPYATAISRFPSRFSGVDWYKVDHKNVRLIAINNNTDYNAAAVDYRLNNPTSYGPTFSGGVKGWDWDGITVANSAQRTAIAGWLNRRSVGERWVFIAQHRQIYGSDLGNSNRLSLLSSAKGYMKAFEDSLATKRGAVLAGDKHIGLFFTVPLKDSAVATSGGFYHIATTGAGGSRVIDTTTAFSAGTTWLEAYLGTDTTEVRNTGRTSVTWPDTLSNTADADRGYEWFWQLYTVYGDHILVQTFRVWTVNSAGCARYNGAGHSVLIDQRTIRRDVG